MAEHKMPEPVAWRCSWHKRGQVVWVQYHDETAPLPATWDARPNETLPLYSAETVRELLAEVERLREERDAMARIVRAVEDAPEAVMDTRDVLGICAPTEEDFPALYALQGKRVRLVEVK